MRSQSFPTRRGNAFTDINISKASIQERKETRKNFFNLIWRDIKNLNTSVKCLRELFSMEIKKQNVFLKRGNRRFRETSLELETPTSLYPLNLSSPMLYRNIYCFRYGLFIRVSPGTGPQQVSNHTLEQHPRISICIYISYLGRADVEAA